MEKKPAATPSRVTKPAAVAAKTPGTPKTTPIGKTPVRPATGAKPAAGAAVKVEKQPGPVTAAEIFQYFTRQLFPDNVDAERDQLVRSKLVEAKDFDLEEELAKLKKRVNEPFELLLSEVKKKEEEVSIIYKKQLEDNSKNTHLQAEAAVMSKTVQDLSSRLSHTENLLKLEQAQSAMLYEKLAHIEKNLKNSSTLINDSLNSIAELRKSSPIQPQAPQIQVQKQILDAQSVIDNLNKVMEENQRNLLNTQESPSVPEIVKEEAETNVSGRYGLVDAVECSQPVETPHNSSLEIDEENHNDEEIEANGRNYFNEFDDEVIHVPQNGKTELAAQADINLNQEAV